MTLRVAINGFGRIGRLVLRSIVEHGRRDIEVVAINDLGPVQTNAHLFRYDSVPWALRRTGERRGRHARRGSRPDEGDGHSRSGAPAAQGPGRRHRSRMHGPVQQEVQGGRSPGRRRAQSAGLRALRWRGQDHRLRCQPRRAEGGRSGGVQRFVHDQLPGGGGQGAAGHLRHRARLHDHHPRLHRRTSRPWTRCIPTSTGRAPRPCR